METRRLAPPGLVALAWTALACSSSGSGVDARDAAGDRSADRAEAAQPADVAAPDAAAEGPAHRPVTDALIAQLRVPPGFRLSVFARDLTNPRMMAVGPDGSVYVTNPMNSEVTRLIDRNRDGDTADSGEKTVVLMRTDAAFTGVHGIAVAGDKMYLAAVKGVFVATLVNGVPQGLTKLVNNLPEGGQHPLRTIGLGPDGKLYVSVGSDCDACAETNTEHATFLRFETTGVPATNPANPNHPMLAHDAATTLSPRVFASGLRNTIGFDWAPGTNELWGVDNGVDGLGDDAPPDELDHITGGASYGWPYCFGDRQPDPKAEEPSPTTTKATYCPKTAPQVAGLPAHGAPIGFVFYRGTQLPEAYRGGAFIALRGSRDRAQPVGYKVVHVPFANGAPSGPAQDVLSGFLIEGGAAQFGRVAGLAVDATGGLLISEDTNGVIYRLQYGDVPDAGAEDAPVGADAAASDGGTDAAQFDAGSDG